MVCTRCGAVQRRASARFCHECGATFELAPTNVQPDASDSPIPEVEAQYAPSIRTVAFTSESDEKTRLQEQPLAEAQLPQPAPAEYPNWIGEAPTALRDQPAARSEEAKNQAAEPFAPPAWLASSNQERAETPFGNQQQPFTPAAKEQTSLSENQQWPPVSPARGPRSAPRAWTDDPTGWERQPQEAFPHPEKASPARGGTFPAAQNSPHSFNQGPFEERSDPPAAPWQTPLAERPNRAATRGPVPGAFQRPRPVKQRRLPLGVIITLGLLLVFIIVGVGIYAIASGSGGQELAAFATYNDPGQHFSIKYPTVWTVKKLPDGVQFADATNTAELSVTYTPNSSNLSAEDFANQEAAKENISTPDSQTFAGTTWVERSGIVTQTSGISQDIFIFVTAANNLLYEVREVAPLDGYKEPNQTDFMPMLQSLKLT